MAITSLSLCAQITLDLHNLNSEGTEGNQQQTRMVHIVSSQGERQNVNAVSGDMFKHILVEHLTPLLESAGEPLSAGARMLNPDRVNADEGFRKAVKDIKSGAEVLARVIKACSVTDVAGTLVTEGGKAVARKSCVEFGWVVGIPEKTHTEQYFHVKYAPETRDKSAGQEPKGEGSVAGRQAIFYRPASSGVYALICQLEFNRVGRNDITHEVMISEESQRRRAQCLAQALLLTLIKPAGAQRNTQNPHIVNCQGVISTSSTHLPAPAFSPLADNYEEEMEKVSETLNQLVPNSISTVRFKTMSEAAAELQNIIGKL